MCAHTHPQRLFQATPQPKAEYPELGYLASPTCLLLTLLNDSFDLSGRSQLIFRARLPYYVSQLCYLLACDLSKLLNPRVPFPLNRLEWQGVSKYKNLHSDESPASSRHFIFSSNYQQIPSEQKVCPLLCPASLTQNSTFYPFDSVCNEKRTVSYHLGFKLLPL